MSSGHSHQCVYHELVCIFIYTLDYMLLPSHMSNSGQPICTGKKCIYNKPSTVQGGVYFIQCKTLKERETEYSA